MPYGAYNESTRDYLGPSKGLRIPAEINTARSIVPGRLFLKHAGPSYLLPLGQRIGQVGVNPGMEVPGVLLFAAYKKTEGVYQAVEQGRTVTVCEFAFDCFHVYLNKDGADTPRIDMDIFAIGKLIEEEYRAALTSGYGFAVVALDMLEPFVSIDVLEAKASPLVLLCINARMLDATVEKEVMMFPVEKDGPDGQMIVEIAGHIIHQ